VAAFALDSSCMVAAVCAWHEHHEAASAHVEDRLERGDTLAIAAHAIAEAYAVLTRLPAPHRLAPADAWALLRANFVEPARVVTLDANGYRDVLGGLAAAGIGGGRTYDALIGRCASQSGVGLLLTLNPRHFDPPPPGVRIVDPRARE
jgi:predicted nucleic acid-binding protein